MIEIEKDKCVGCGLCARVCSQGNGNIIVDGTASILSEKCQMCGQCLEVCPNHAIHWDISSEEAAQVETMPDAKAFGDVIMNRKSIRHYLSLVIEEDVIKHLIKVAQNAPTAGNCRDLKITVIREEKSAFVKYLVEAYRQFFNTHSEAEILTFFGGVEAYYDKWKHYIDAYDKNGSDEVIFGAPATVLISGTERYLPDAGMMAQSMVLLAQTYGLGSCYVGFMRRAAKISEEYRRFLNLRDEEEILTAFTLGYPAIQYKRNVAKKPFEVMYR